MADSVHERALTTKVSNFQCGWLHLLVVDDNHIGTSIQGAGALATHQPLGHAPSTATTASCSSSVGSGNNPGRLRDHSSA
jgi:hypothetical protein